MKPTRWIFGRSFFVALIISLLLPFGFADAGVIVKDSSGNQLTGVDISGKIATPMWDEEKWAIAGRSLTAEQIAQLGLQVDSLTLQNYGRLGTAEHITQAVGDSTTHYVDRLDTTYRQARIICDTLFRISEITSDGAYLLRLTIECDTVYVQHISPHWAPLKAPLLRPDQIAELMRILSLGDSFPDVDSWIVMPWLSEDSLNAHAIMDSI